MKTTVRPAALPGAPRVAHDSFGDIEIPAGARWGAQTARSLHFFGIGEQRMPIALVRAMAHIKWAAATVNHELGLLDVRPAAAIASAAQRVTTASSTISSRCRCGRPGRARRAT